MWVVSDRAAIRAVFEDPDTFAARTAHTPITPLCDEALDVLFSGCQLIPVTDNCDDRAVHRRVRQALTKLFSPGRVAALEPGIRATARRLIAARHGRMDVVRDFAIPLAADTVLTFLGVPREDHRQIIDWVAGKTDVDWGEPTEQEQIASAHNMVALWRYCDAWAGRTTILDLPHREKASALMVLCLAGFDAPAALIVNELAGTGTPIKAWRRVTTTETTVDGVTIPAGADVLLRIDGDPALSFGRGIHACVGANLARTLAAIAAEELAALPGLVVHAPEEPANLIFRMPAHLRVEWDHPMNDEMAALCAAYGITEMRGALDHKLGIEVLDASAEKVTGRMPVEGNTQVIGLLHGGASAAFAEYLGALGAALHGGPEKIAVCIESSISHLRGTSGGFVHGTATRQHGGRQLATYLVEITSEDGELIASARMTVKFNEL
jgi:1,4-dihydroxy-2-naphthoyl-CoA hydrolase